MIVGPDFIWLHFPKCAGTSVEQALQKLFKNRDDISFDAVGENDPVIWHETIQQRMERDPSFQVGRRKIVACIRRLPSWILSRVHFEASRHPHHQATREMMLDGHFFEQSGFVNHADQYVSIYDNPSVDKWIRTENLIEDFAEAFQIGAVTAKYVLPHTNATEYDDGLSTEEKAKLYASCPAWAELERRVYGSI